MGEQWLPRTDLSHSNDTCRVRALGETDLNPVSGLGKISQLLFAWIQPGNIVANIIAGGVAEAGAQQSVVSSNLVYTLHVNFSSQSWGSHARLEDWPPRPGIPSCSILRTIDRINTLHLCYIHSLFSLYKSLPNPWSLVPCAYCLCVARSGASVTYVCVCFLRRLTDKCPSR